jgi:hypothetical protein
MEQTELAFAERWAARVGRAAAQRPRAHLFFFAAGACFIPLILLPLVTSDILTTLPLGLLAISAGGLLLIVGLIWRNRRDYWRIVTRERLGTHPAAAEPGDPRRTRRERKLVRDGLAALKNPQLPILLLVNAAIFVRVSVFCYTQSIDPARLMWVSSALTTLTFLGVALNHFETIAFSRIVERQRARVRELEDQRQAARTIEPLAYQHQIQKLVARIRAGDRAPDDTYTCPRCGNRTCCAAAAGGLRSCT